MDNMFNADSPVPVAFRGAVVAIASWHQFAGGAVIRQPRVESRMVLWCKQGFGEVEVDSQMFSMHAGDYLVMPMPHAVTYRADGAAPFYVGGVHVITNHHRNHPVKFDVAHDRTSPLADCSWREDVEIPGLEGVIFGALSAHPGLHHLLEYTVWRYTRSREPKANEMRMLGRLLLIELLRSLEVEVAAEEQGPTQIRRAMCWVRDHVDQRPALDELAEIAGCSTSTLQRQFQNHLGLTPLQWVARVKLEKSSELIRATAMPIAEVARAIGIEDQFYFSRWFRKLTGESPRQFRQHTRNI